MTVPASDIFDFLEQHPVLSIERHEVSSAEFSILRRSLRSIILRLREGEDDDARDISDRLRMLLSEWLTVPVEFDGTILEAVETLGEPGVMESRWGRDVRTWYDAARMAARNVALHENPVREHLRALIRQLRVQGRDFRISCHRRAATRFESVLDQPEDVSLGTQAFLHSVKDYRETAPFEVLIKVGPLRSRGWGAVPDAIVIAPRFGQLTQIVWSGCCDEADFGYDPVVTLQSGMTAGRASVAGITWTTQVTRTASDVPLNEDARDMDELGLFRELNRVRERRRATLIQIDEAHGILYPVDARVLSLDLDPGAPEPLDRRLPGSTLVEGMYTVRPLSLDADLGGLRAEHGHYSGIWRERLSEEYGKDARDLTRRLRKAGLDLVHLGSAMVRWCKAPTAVIHAPQQARHFKILIDVLGLAVDSMAVTPGPRSRAWWECAWDEIRRSRGEAIQAGVQEQEIIEEQFRVTLNVLLPSIRLRAAEGGSFVVPIPPGHGLGGSALFGRVCCIEEGFLAPDSELRVVRDLDAIEQWRA